MQPQPRHDPLLQRLGGLHAVGGHHEGLDPLHPSGILDADDAAVGHLGAAVDDILQLGGIDVVAVGYDHALDALMKVHKALGVHMAQIAGVKPGVAVGQLPEGLRRLLRQLEIAQHDRGPLEDDLPLGIRGKQLRGAGPHDAVGGIREGQADASLPMLVPGGEAAGGDAFGQAVALAHLDGGVVLTQEGVDLLFELHGQAVAPAEHAQQEAHVQAVQLGHMEQGLKNRGHAGDEIRLAPPEHVGIAFVVEGGHENAAHPVDQHRVQVDAQAEAVEHGHAAEHGQPPAELHPDGRPGLHGAGVEIPIRQADALGHAAGAAGIEDDRGARCVRPDLRQRGALAGFEEIAP